MVGRWAFGSPADSVIGRAHGGHGNRRVDNRIRNGGVVGGRRENDSREQATAQEPDRLKQRRRRGRDKEKEEKRFSTQAREIFSRPGSLSTIRSFLLHSLILQPLLRIEDQQYAGPIASSPVWYVLRLDTSYSLLLAANHPCQLLRCQQL